MKKEIKKNKKIDNYNNNIELLNYFTSTKRIKDVLASIYGEIDEDIVNVVFYSIYNDGIFESFYNITRSVKFQYLLKSFSKINLIPIYENRLTNEYIGYNILDKRFNKITFKKPISEEFLIVTLFNKQAYLSCVQSSKFEYYCNLTLIKQEYEVLIEKVKNFIKTDNKFKKFLKNIEYKENSRKKRFLFKYFAIIKQMQLCSKVLLFLKNIRVNTTYNEVIEKMVSCTIIEYLNELLRLD
ncbi:MAG: hypothetical protein E7376_00915 [Clostridiales bacterium]|nr:hypothetical protein [Clostridiales bacterium]